MKPPALPKSREMGAIESFLTNTVNLLLAMAPIAALLMSEKYSEFALINFVVQMVIFLFVAMIPGLKTGRLSYVDMAWPYGLTVIGVLTLMMATGTTWRRVAAGVAFLFMGGRMSLGATKYWSMGFLDKEFPRYDYRKLVWKNDGIEGTRATIELQIEILKQAHANICLCVLPALLIGFHEDAEVHILEIVGFGLTFLAYVWEAVADRQKLAFLIKCKKEGLTNQVCNKGLWSVVRHPNYFGEWNVWNGLVIASIPSLIALINGEKETQFVCITLAASTVFVSYLFYDFLVHQTGAIPAEYYSVQKRPDYKKF